MTPRFSPDYGWDVIKAAILPARPNARLLLEEQFQLKSGHKHAIALNYGRAGLYFLLKSLQTTKRDVILPSDTCVVVAHAIVLAGFKPVFLDNSPGSRQPSQESYMAAVNQNTAVVIPTHLYGIPQDTKDLYQYIKTNYPDVFILQDCAHSFFCTDSSGTSVTEWGDGAIFGMNISKLVNSVKGGVLTINDTKLAEKVRNQLGRKTSSSLASRVYAILATFAFSPIFDKVLYFVKSKTSLLSSQTDYFQEDTIDLPEDLAVPINNFSAEIGLRSLNRYDSRISQRREIASAYTRILHQLNHPDIIWFPPILNGATWSHYPILVTSTKRSALQKSLQKAFDAEIGVIVDYSVADLGAYAKKGHPSCPLALEESKQILNLPLTWFESNLGKRKNSKEVISKCENALLKVFSQGRS